MKNTKFLDGEAVELDQVDAEWVSLTLDGEKYVFDANTLYDLSFRFASLLAHMEAQEEHATEAAIELTCAECAGKLH